MFCPGLQLQDVLGIYMSGTAVIRDSSVLAQPIPILGSNLMKEVTEANRVDKLHGREGKYCELGDFYVYA